MARLDVTDLSVVYGHGRAALRAVDGVSFSVEGAGTLGIVGESGSGKSTVARAIVGLVDASAGDVAVDGVSITRANRGSRRTRRRIQMVFQDPSSCLDPRMTVGASIEEAIEAAVARGVTSCKTQAQRRGRVEELLGLVHLDAAFAQTLPSSLSGGQRQRVALVRAIAAEPDILIADEITSALDVSVQGSVLNALMDLQDEFGIAVLFISHNVPIVRQLCDQVVVMNGGRIVEAGAVSDVLVSPKEEYTKQLLAAVPTLGGQLFEVTANTSDDGSGR